MNFYGLEVELCAPFLHEASFHKLMSTFVRQSPIPESKPFIPVDRKPEPNAAGLLPGDEVINSDLDDSDDEVREEDDGGEEEGEVDIVFCVYDKVSDHDTDDTIVSLAWGGDLVGADHDDQVQRVKNKWKTTFKDGMIHINGRDYLFAKCSG